MALLVPTPTLQQDGNLTPLLVSEKPIRLSCSPIVFGDGTPLTILNQPKATFLIYRLLSGGIQQVLDSSGKAWVSPGPSVSPQNLFWNDKAKSWQAIIVAIGNKDAAGIDFFATDPITTFPKYAAQCSFSGTDASGAQQFGQSVLSSPVEIIAPGQNNLAGLTMDPQPPDPTTAQEIRIFLKNSALIEQGQVTILQDGFGFHVQLVAGGSTVVLSSSGDIVLSPANGRPVQVNGDLTVSNRIFVGGVQVAVP